jgi:cysteine-rich repeat protein
MPSTRDVCVAGACVASVCGDRFTDTGATPAEECDDGNTTGGDGCDDGCQLEACSDASDCDDGNPCTAGHSCPDGTCVLGTPMADGATCDDDSMPSTRDICLDGLCMRSVCGDGYVDVGASEECDDGNTASGDGCESDCTIPAVPITAFRITSAELMDPHLYAEVSAGTCTDITSTVNTLLADNLANHMINFVGLFQPLDLTMSATPLEVDFLADCMAGSPRDECGPRTGTSTIASTANNTLPASMTCLTPDSAVLNPSYSGTVNSPGGPCFVTDDQTFTVSLGGVPVRLQSARLAATYVSGASPTRLVNGVLVGFLSETDARATTLDSALPIVGGDTLYEHLAHGGAAGSACTGDSSFTTDDSDTLAGESGFWFYLNFEAELADWTP